jgi:hypothetical protein
MDVLRASRSRGFGCIASWLARRAWGVREGSGQVRRPDRQQGLGHVLGATPRIGAASMTDPNPWLSDNQCYGKRRPGPEVGALASKTVAGPGECGWSATKTDASDAGGRAPIPVSRAYCRAQSQRQRVRRCESVLDLAEVERGLSLALLVKRRRAGAWPASAGRMRLSGVPANRFFGAAMTSPSPTPPAATGLVSQPH